MYYAVIIQLKPADRTGYLWPYLRTAAASFAALHVDPWRNFPSLVSLTSCNIA